MGRHCIWRSSAVALLAATLWSGFHAPGWAQEDEMGGEEIQSPQPSHQQTITVRSATDDTAEEIGSYTVKEGDTLWDISQSVLDDSFLWPRIWRNNPYIVNPDLIYPGNVIHFTSKTAPIEEALPVEAATPMEMPEEAEFQPEPEMEVEEEMPSIPQVALVAPLERVPPSQASRPNLALLASAGFIIVGEEYTGTVVGGRDNRELLGEGQIAFILPQRNATLALGDRLTLYRHVRKVYHPKTRKYLGDLVKILGTAEITESGEKVKSAQIVDSYDYITIGDLALPYSPLEFGALPSRESQGASSGSGALQGYIVEVKDGRVITAQSDIVYLDRGMKDGLKAGDRFAVVRQGEKTPRFSPGRGERLPKEVIGRLEVLLVRDATSTARIIESTDTINKGDEFESLSTP